MSELTGYASLTVDYNIIGTGKLLWIQWWWINKSSLYVRMNASTTDNITSTLMEASVCTVHTTGKYTFSQGFRNHL